MTDSHSPAAAPTADLHLRRVRLMLWLGSGLLISIGLVWSLYFAYREEWVLVVLDALMIAVGAVVLALMRRKRTRLAFYLLLGCVFWVVCGISLVFDIPSPGAPRSAHHYLLLLAVTALLFLRDEKGHLRHVVAAVCFATYIALGSTTAALVEGYALPDSVRVGGTWFNITAAIGAVYAMLHIMLSDIASISAQELELRRGIARGEFFLMYQPQVASDGRVVGAEALLRWAHPQRGVVAPGEFIGLAEQTGLINSLGLRALEIACRELLAWSRKPGMQELTISVNVSAQQFQQPHFVSQVQSVLERLGVRPHRLKLELTESLLVHDIDDIVQKMEALKNLGVGFSLDDFGTGFSSLNYLKRLPLDQLKIDQSFVRDVLTDPNDAAIARTVIALGKSMGFAVIAEGVETEGQRAFLVENDCHIFQGYLFSHPLRALQFSEYVLRNYSRPELQGVGTVLGWLPG